MEGPDFVPCAVPSVVHEPPLEEHLAQNTLWPEIRKLYGHGNDVFCACSSPSGRLIASACKAQSAGAAAVWVWEVSKQAFLTWVDSGVVEMIIGFGALVSMAPDKRCSWHHTCTVHEGECRCFATSSRDQTVKVWALAANGHPGARPTITLPPFPAGVTAVALAPAHVTSALRAASSADDSCGAELADVGGLHLLAVGLEDGQVQVWSVCLRDKSITQEGGGEGECKAQQLWASKQWEQHAATVRRLRWAPAGVDWLCGRAGGAHIDGCPQLASCGEDHSVRLFCINLGS
eukprot:gene8436-8618_t